MEPDSLDRILRDTFSTQPRPRPAPRLAADVMARLAAREVSRRRSAPGARLLLGAYWSAAVVASAWILSRLPWPDGTEPGLWYAACAAVPAGYALSLWPRAAVQWARLLVHPLLAAERR